MPGRRFKIRFYQILIFISISLIIGFVADYFFDIKIYIPLVVGAIIGALGGYKLGDNKVKKANKKS